LNTSLLLSLALIALGIAANPPGIVVQIGVLSTPNGRVKGLTYLAGLLVSLVAFAALAVAIFGRFDLSEKGAPSTAAWVIHLLAGAIVAGAGVWLWRQPAQAVGGFIGKALEDLDHIKLGTVFLLGFLLVNYPLEIAGATAILQAKPPTPAAFAGYFLFFAVLASSTIWIPVVIQVAMPDRWVGWSSASREWIVKDGNVVLGALIVVIGGAIALQAVLALLK
jgi:hypothetical protein